jgi:hypothetical protein
MTKLLTASVHVVNVGLPSFADSVRQAGGDVIHLDWRPPAQGDAAIGRALARLVGDPAVDAANDVAFSRYVSARPVLKGIGIARETVPGFDDRMLLHSGPPIEWERMSGPMQGALTGAVLLERWTSDEASARDLLASGDIALQPCHHHGAVGPMAGVIAPSMPVWIVEDAEHGGRAYSNMNEGLGKVLRFGAFSDDVIDRLRWMAAELAPAVSAAIEQLEGIELKPLIAQALHMGDECHNRNVAASSLLFKRLAPAMLRAGVPAERTASVLEFIAANDHFFLNVSMAACKAMADAAHGVPGSSMVTALSRNGVDFGIRVSGTGDSWFTVPAPVVQGLYFAGFSAEDAAPDLGDSAIAETAGLGGFAMGAAPAIVQFVGGTPADAVAYTREMYNVTLGSNPSFTLPPLGFAPTPAGIDVLRVVDTGIEPVINTGIAHREAGVGQVGAGVARAPLACFVQAVAALAALAEKAER